MEAELPSAVRRKSEWPRVFSDHFSVQAKLYSLKTPAGAYQRALSTQERHLACQSRFCVAHQFKQHFKGWNILEIVTGPLLA